MPVLRRSPCLLLTALAVLVVVASGAQAQDADLIVTNARIWTGDSARPRAEALGVRGERLLVVGTNAEVERHRTALTRVIDAGGRLVTPGFIDNHTHFSQAGALLLGAKLLDVARPDSFMARIRAARDRLPDGSWITGGDWGAYEDWATGSTGAVAGAAPRQRFSPVRGLLDSITPRNGVLLQRWDRTAFLANYNKIFYKWLNFGIGYKSFYTSFDYPI